MVRPTKSNKLKEAHNYLVQAEQAHQIMERMRQEPLPPGATRFEDNVIFEDTEFIAVKVPEKDIDKARDFIARIQAKDEAHRKEVHDGWVVSPEPQFVHLGCSKAESGTKTVVIRKCPCAVATARDGKEPYCIACRLIVHTLNMGEVDAPK